MENPKKGMNLNQIKKAIFGKEKPKISIPKNKSKKTTKPSKIIRKTQQFDLGLLLDITYSSNQLYNQIPTPDWFTYNGRADISIICPLYLSELDTLTEFWDFNYEGFRVEFIFVDDNCPWKSSQKLIDAWQKRKDEIKNGLGRIFLSSATQGYGACCNLGAEKATGKYLIFLHPESKLFPGWLFSLIKMIQRPEVGAVGGLHVYEEQDTVLEAGLEWSWEDNEFLPVGSKVFKSKKLQQAFSMNNVPLEIFQANEREAASSDFMAVKKSDFQELGGFCSSIFNQKWSDADFSCTLREKGLKVMYQQTARSYHKVRLANEKYEKHGKVAFNNKWIVSGRLDKLVSPRSESIPEINNILVRRGYAHGDVLVAAAIAPALKKKYPNSKIIFATGCPEVLDGNPWIDQVVTEYSERLFNYFINLDMAYEYRPKTNFLTAYAETAGVNPNDCELFLKTEPIEDELPENYVVMHAGNTFWAGRGWSTIKFDQISNRLRKEGYKVVCVGKLSDHKPICSDLDLRDKTNIAQLAYVIKNCNFFVGTDSFPMVVAETFHKKGVAFFGSILPQTRLITNSIKPIYADGIKCLGCHHRKPLPCVATISCEVGVQECVIGVSVDRMWQEIQKLIN